MAAGLKGGETTLPYLGVFANHFVNALLSIGRHQATPQLQIGHESADGMF